jgi:alpha-tubulin N-acetyltransferase 1
MQEVFEKFLIAENKTPEKLAYDRPSEKLIGFLKKHYSLSAFLPQNNNFVIFDRFFGEKSKPIKEDSRIK